MHSSSRITTGRRIRFLFLFIFSFFIIPGLSQQLNYDELFAGDWKKALRFVRDNEKWMRQVSEKYSVPYPFAVAVVFPELVRYSALRDKMEITMLKTLYRNLGEDYADFSVGVFQVKPSFAEKVRDEYFSGSGPQGKNPLGKKGKFRNARDFRGSIIADLENPQTEFNYVIAFMKICERNFPFASAVNDTSKIKFLATAYNSGFWKNREEIEKMSDLKFFNTKIVSSESYTYADVSLFWYNKYARKEKNL